MELPPLYLASDVSKSVGEAQHLAAVFHTAEAHRSALAFCGRLKRLQIAAVITPHSDRELRRQSLPLTTSTVEPNALSAPPARSRARDTSSSETHFPRHRFAQPVSASLDESNRLL